MVANTARVSYNRRVPTRPNTSRSTLAPQPCPAGRIGMTRAQVFAACQHLPAAHP